ncbi:MAG: UDP-glucose/GDP-mannose dehydrogenase family protein [Planctomycetes bacterium]|nr:UDP-glucose/GDP-mannose dehydrogenase family protein [Planctomycetota bacterium]
MKVTIAGTGYVGLVSATCLASTGNTVIGYDIDKEKIATLGRGECPIFEPGLHELLVSNLKAGRLHFTADADEALTAPDVIFITIGTPPRPDGSADLSQIMTFAEDAAVRVTEPTVVATKSTVPVGTGDRLEQLFRKRARVPVYVASNPEFLKEGSAVADFLRPDRVIIGADAPEAVELLRELHLPFVRNQRPILVMPRRASEMTKYAANTLLASRISFINEVANLCDACGVDVDDVRRGIGSDSRIGFQFLYPGAGYGGSCFPKDVQALAHIARQAGVDPVLLEAVHRVNEAQKLVLFNKIKNRFGQALAGMSAAVWGVSFKPETDDLREAPALTLIDQLLEAGVTVRVHDPAAMERLSELYHQRVACHAGPYDALEGADFLVICTEWNEFRSPEFPRMRRLLSQPIIFDGRNLYDLEAMRRHGMEYYPVGRPAVNRAL